MAIDRKAYRAAKKKYKSTVRSNKKADKSDRKHNKKADKNLKKQKKKDLKTLKKMEQAGPKRGYTLSRKYTPMIDPGDKPKRSDYKRSKPQKATGSAASMSRMINMVTSLPEPRMFVPTMVNKPEPFPQVTKMPVDKIMNAATKRTSKRKGRR